MATGKHPSQTPATSGFTLIEIIMVLGLMACAAAITIINFASMADRGDSQTTEDILQSAVREARFIAARERSVTELRFDKESGSLLISGERASGEPFKLNDSFNKAGPANIQFYLVSPSIGLAPPTDASRTRLETTEVEFAPDRSASPFVADIDTGSGTPTRMIFDPFSSLLITPK